MTYYQCWTWAKSPKKIGPRHNSLQLAKQWFDRSRLDRVKVWRVNTIGIDIEDDLGMFEKESVS